MDNNEQQELQTVLVMLSKMDDKLDKIRDKQEESAIKISSLEKNSENLQSQIETVTKDFEAVNDKLSSKVSTHAEKINNLELARARQAGFIAAASAVFAVIVAYVKDKMGNLL